MNKLTTREKRLGIRQLINEESATITLKEVVDEINNGKKRGDKGFIKHANAMNKVQSLIGLNSGFGWCPKIGHQYISGKGRIETIETYVLNYEQAVTTAASLNDKVLLWVMQEFKRMKMVIRNNNIQLDHFNQNRLAVVDTNKAMNDSVKSNYARRNKKPAYAAEATMTFKIAIGMSHANFRLFNDLAKGTKVREHLSSDQLAVLQDIERANKLFLDVNMDYQERKQKLLLSQYNSKGL